jgi:hypothetical protein
MPGRERLMHPRRGILGVSLAVLAAVGLWTACSDSSGPGDTTIVLSIDPVPSPTNELNPAISGLTDPGATVTITGPVDTVSALAGAAGDFSITVTLGPDALTELEVVAVDSAGNQTGDTLDMFHDGRAPALTFTSPGSGSTTLGQSRFPIEVAFADDTVGVEFASGSDAATFFIENDRDVGGVFQTDGTFTTSYPAGSNLAPLFTSVSESGASLVVDDSAAFPPGVNQLLARVTDLAGNRSLDRVLSFNVGADPDRLILVDARGGAGSSGNPVVVGLANADSVGGAQFDFIYSSTIIALVDSLTVGDRATAFDGVDFNQIAPGQVRVLLFDSGGDLIPAGQGPILTLWVTVAPSAPSGAHLLTLGAILLSDRAGATRSLPDATGTFTVP